MGRFSPDPTKLREELEQAQKENAQLKDELSDLKRLLVLVLNRQPNRMVRVFPHEISFLGQNRDWTLVREDDPRTGTVVFKVR